MDILDWIEKSVSSQIIVIAIVVFLLVWAIKNTSWVSKKLLPLVSMALGIIVGYVVSLQFGSPFEGMVEGFIAGGFASGGYDALRPVFDYLGISLGQVRNKVPEGESEENDHE